MEKATFAAGCFWCVEPEFRKLEGVVEVACGYMGGMTENPSYEDVCTDETGHAEVVEITYDPTQLSYEKLLQTFFEIHDPTELNRQGPDEGTQYRSSVFYHSEKQKELALKYKKELDLSKKYPKPIVTEVIKAAPFYRAEEYHQRYFEKNAIKPHG